MTFLNIILIGLLFVILIAALYKREKRNKSKQEMRSLRLSPEPENKPASNSYSWISHIEWVIGAFGGVGAGLKYAYDSWKNAPAGSMVKLGWEALFTLFICLGLWAILKFIDNKINRQETPSYVKSDDLSAQIALMQMGEKNDPINR